MVITIDAELEEALTLHAKRLGITPEQFAIDTLRRRLLNKYLPPPENEWHARLRSIGTDCGVPSPDTTYGREEMYD